MSLRPGRHTCFITGQLLLAQEPMASEFLAASLDLLESHGARLWVLVSSASVGLARLRSSDS